MNIDQYGLPVQKDRDAADQLQRVGMIGIAQQLTGFKIKEVTDPWRALLNLLQPAPGLYTRSVNATTKDVTGDQLIPVISFWVILHSASELRLMWRRLFFAQNVTKQGEPNVRTIPDFMFFRSLPLFMRIAASSAITTWLLYPLVFISDLLLLPLLISSIMLQRKLDDVDDNNLIVTLVTCSAVMPTPIGRFTCWLYKRYRPINYGSVSYNCHPVIGALRWYHRPEWPSYGNPEIAMIWEPLVNKYIVKNA